MSKSLIEQIYPHDDNRLAVDAKPVIKIRVIRFLQTSKEQKAQTHWVY